MKKSHSFIYTIISVLLFSCSSEPSEKQESNKQVYDAGYFHMKIPANWQIKKSEGIDVQSLIYFISNKKDTIVQEISSYANSLTEEEPNIKPYSAKKIIDSATLAENKVIFLSDGELMRGVDIDKYRKQNVNYKDIDEFEIKVITPREIGKGITGFYCDSIGNDKTIGRIRVNMHGKNLAAETQEELLEAISTLDFKKK